MYYYSTYDLLLCYVAFICTIVFENIRMNFSGGGEFKLSKIELCAKLQSHFASLYRKLRYIDLLALASMILSRITICTNRKD